ncbi:MAG TPA: hypothetical protein VGB85_14705, partial [Nannocystis sp.]
AIPAEVQEHYDRGARERDAGNFAVAASEFAAAYAGMPASQKELRVSVLFDLVDAQRQAYGAGGRIHEREHPAAHLCAANETLTEFIDAAEKARKGKGKKSGDVVRAIELRSEVRSQLDAARQSAPNLDCATAEPPTAAAVEAPAEPPPATKPDRPPRKIDKPLVITGAALTGFGLIMVGLMAGGLVRGNRADAEGEALVDASPTTPRDDEDLLAIDHRGKVGNRMAIAGGVLGALALGSGVALLVLGLRGRPSRVAVAPAMGPRGGGLTLRWQF